MLSVRRQLTLFIENQGEIIEGIRAAFNPVQFQLIPAHVTLCRENEIESLAEVISNLRLIQKRHAVRIEFDPIERFADGKGILIPAKKNNLDFDNLRKAVLKGLNDNPENYQAHITLMHPRNSTCTDQIFKHIEQIILPKVLFFNTISLIEQRNGGKWSVIEQF